MPARPDGNCLIEVTDQNQPTTEAYPLATGPMRLFYLVLAYVCVAIGVAGAFLPLLPAVPFLLVAVWAGQKGSRRVHDWIYAQPKFAKMLNDWHDEGAIPLYAKWIASIMMFLSWLFMIRREYHWGTVLLMSVIFVSIAIWMWTRPNPKP